MASVKLEGSLSAGPGVSTTTTSGAAAFPGASFDVPLGLGNVAFTQGTGVLRRDVDSAAAFTLLEGPGVSVPKGRLLYLRCDAELTLRFTQDDGAGGDVVQTLTIQGAYIAEFPSAKFLKLLEAQGVATVEYLVTGDAA